MGRRRIQALVINSSNFNRFNVERIKQTKKRRNNKKRKKREKRINIQKDIPIILAYSVKRIKEKYKEEYSVIKPATNSDSASGKSKGTLFDSANIQIKKNAKRTWKLAKVK